MSHSTYVAKIASPAVESSWHLLLSINFTHYCISAQSHCGLTPTKGGLQSSVCVDVLWCFTDAYCTLEKSMNAGTYICNLTSSVHKQSVEGAHPHRNSRRARFRLRLKCHACTLLHCLHGMLQAVMQYLTWEYVPHELYLSSLKLHHYQFPPNIHSCILIIAKVWMWIADSLKLNL